jgi:hypothetical protein
MTEGARKLVGRPAEPYSRLGSPTQGWGDGSSAFAEEDDEEVGGPAAADRARCEAVFIQASLSAHVVSHAGESAVT